jgi:hypothetical protein
MKCLQCLLQLLLCLFLSQPIRSYSPLFAASKHFSFDLVRIHQKSRCLNTVSKHNSLEINVRCSASQSSNKILGSRRLYRAFQTFNSKVMLFKKIERPRGPPPSTKKNTEQGGKFLSTFEQSFHDQAPALTTSTGGTPLRDDTPDFVPQMGLHPSVDTGAFISTSKSSDAPVAWFRCQSSRRTQDLFTALPNGGSLEEYMSLPPSQYVNFGGVERVQADTPDAHDTSKFLASLPPITFAPGIIVQPVCLLAAQRPAPPAVGGLGAGCDISAVTAEVRGSSLVEALNGAFVCSFAMRIRHLPASVGGGSSQGRIGADCELAVGVQGTPIAHAAHTAARPTPAPRTSSANSSLAVSRLARPARAPGVTGGRSWLLWADGSMATRAWVAVPWRMAT